MTMKRIRFGAPDDEEKTLEAVQDGGAEDQMASRPSLMANLPYHILIEILSRLPVKDIFTCRCVCRTWLNLLLDSQFADLHFTRANPICRLVQPKRWTPMSEYLYLVELNGNPAFDIGGRRFSGDVGDCTCDDNRICSSSCDVHFKMKLDTKFMVPKINFKGKRMNEFQLLRGDFQMVNSCNGLLCLCEPKCGNLFVIYNPITGEYINLPKAEKDKFSVGLPLGFGFSPKSNQYKVLKKALQVMEDESTYVWVTKVITIGMGVWRIVKNPPCFLSNIYAATCLNGSLHWLCGGDVTGPLRVLSFDIDSEQFRLITPPPPYLNREHKKNRSKISMGVLEGCLYICDVSSYDPIDIWVMKEYGVPESWTNVGLPQRINYLNNGNLLMHHTKSAIISYDGLRCRHLEICGTPSKFVVVGHTPSFVPLKDAVRGDNMKVLNVKSRSSMHKPQEAIGTLFLVEEDIGTAPPDSDHDVSTESSSEEEDWESEEEDWE